MKTYGEVHCGRLAADKDRWCSAYRLFFAEARTEEYKEGQNLGQVSYVHLGVTEASYRNKQREAAAIIDALEHFLGALALPLQQKCENMQAGKAQARLPE